MESSDEANTKVIDPVVGGLVWVRRRNGSWWPGRILGADELPESCLVTPRSGTPVKLLGREDASVDWYNLEKSRRVKAFRCGEYDECIEKAKASAANSCKKAVKYARREDAILHALELESAREPKETLEIWSGMDIPDGEQGGAEEVPATFEPGEGSEQISEESSSFEDNSNSAQELSQSGVSFEEPNQVIISKEQSVHGRRRRTPNDSEEDGAEGTKRMRGLEDLGMGGGVSKVKRKRSQVAHVHEFLKKKNRRRQLAKVLESTAMVTVPVMCEPLASPTGSCFPGVSDSKVSGIESNDSKKSFSVVINNNSDSTGVSCEIGASLIANGHACDAPLRICKQKENEISSMLELPEDDSSGRLFDVPFIVEDKNHPGFSSAFVSSTSQKPHVGAGAQSSQSSQVETVSLGNEEFNESGSTSSGAADISQRIDKGTSKWQLKGKRKSRHKSKTKKEVLRKFMDMDVDDESNAYLEGIEASGAFSLGSGQKVNCSPLSEGFTYQWKSGQDMETEVDEVRGGWNSGHLSHKESHIKGPPAEVLAPQRLLPYRQSRFTVNPKYSMSDIPLRNYDTGTLYDVEIEVKASYRPQHVPYISLMSKLNGRPIIGHPLAVEVLDDGFYDFIMNSAECYSSSCELDDIMEEDTSALQDVDTVREVKPNRGGGSRVSSKHVTMQTRASPSKSPKLRKSGPSSKKIRKLSSLTGTHKLSEEEKKPAAAKLKGPSVACVPLKVVFSRINAALNSSMRPVHRVATTSQLRSLQIG